MSIPQPLISIIVPIYRVEQYLDACVQSLINQTYPDLEIILVDDGSPDNCGAICDDYAAKDPRIKVIHKENGGLSDARNAGMAISTGAYLSCVDSDDLLPYDALQVMVDIALRENVELVIGGLPTLWSICILWHRPMMLIWSSAVTAGFPKSRSPVPMPVRFGS